MVHPEEQGRDQQGEPDPGHFERFCVEAVPEMLSSCQVGEELARRGARRCLGRGYRRFGYFEFGRFGLGWLRLRCSGPAFRPGPLGLDTRRCYRRKPTAHGACYSRVTS